MFQPMGVVGFTLPYDHDFPTFLFQGRYGSGVTLPVRGEFICPEFSTGLGCRGSFASFVAVPETAMDKDHFPATSKHNVGSPRKISGVKPKSITSTMKEPSNNHLRPGIPAPNLPHQSTSCCVRPVL